MVTSAQLQEQGITINKFFDQIIEHRVSGNIDAAFDSIMELSKKQKKALVDYVDGLLEEGVYGDMQTALQSVRNVAYQLI